MLALLSLVPWWGRIVTLLALAAAIWGHGFYTAHHRDAAKYDALQAEYSGFKGNVAALGKAAEAHTAQVEAKQKEITDALAKDYAAKLARLPKFGGVRQPTKPGGGEIAQLSCTPASINGPAADAVSAVAQADFDTLANLAAQTTQQLVSLQGWVREQQAAFQ